MLRLISPLKRNVATTVSRSYFSNSTYGSSIDTASLNSITSFGCYRGHSLYTDVASGIESPNRMHERKAQLFSGSSKDVEAHNSDLLRNCFKGSADIRPPTSRWFGNKSPLERNLRNLEHHQVRFMSTTSSNYPAQHKHDALWKAERYLSLALLGVLPAAWVIPHPVMDYAVALSLVVHVHWGVEAIVTDYVRPSIFGPVIPKVSIALVYILSILAAGGLFLFNWTDVGITQAVTMLSRI